MYRTLISLALILPQLVASATGGSLYWCLCQEGQGCIDFGASLCHCCDDEHSHKNADAQLSGSGGPTSPQVIEPAHHDCEHLPIAGQIAASKTVIQLPGEWQSAHQIGLIPLACEAKCDAFAPELDGEQISTRSDGGPLFARSTVVLRC